MMRSFFWFCWSIELAFLLFMLFQDLQTPHLPITPGVWLGFIWLGAALFVRSGLRGMGMANVMVGLPALLLVVYAGFVALAVALGGRWN